MDSFIYAVLMLMLYFLPYAIAKSKNRANTTAIFWVNAAAFLVLPWFVALIWALTEGKTEAQKMAELAKAMRELEANK